MYTNIENLYFHCMMRQLFLLLVLSPACMCCLYAQDFSLTQYDERNGLTADVVYGINQDKNGFIWLTTENGLFRFDGTNFKKYTVEDGLTDNVNFGAYSDSSNRMIFYSFSNKPCYLYKDRFYSSNTDTTLGQIQLKGNQCYTIHKPTNSFFVNHIGGNFFYRLRFVNNRLETKKITLSEKVRIHSIIPFEKQVALLCDENDSVYLNVYSGSKLITSNKLFSVANGGGMPVAMYQKGVFYIASSNKLFGYRATPSGHLNLSFKKTLEWAPKNIFPSSDGYWLTSFQTGIYHFGNKKMPDKFLTDVIANSVHEDKDLNIWVSTDGKGVFHLKRNKIKNVSAHLENTMGNRALSLAVGANGAIYCGMDKLMVSCYEKGRKTDYLLSEGMKPKDGFVTCIGLLNTRRLLCCTNKDLLVLDLITRKVTPIRLGEVPISNTKSLFIETPNNFYIGTGGNLYRVSTYSRTATVDTLFFDRTLSIHKDAFNNIWVGTLNGLYCKKANGNRFELCPIEPLKSAKINHIAERNGFLYFATDRGIVISNLRQIYTINKTMGLTDENCKKIYLYGNNIYTATSSGVFRASLTSDSTVGNMVQYNQWDGMASDNVNDIQFFTDSLWVATNKGLNVFKETDITHPSPPVMNLLSLVTNKGKYSVHEPVTLPPGENNITISYVGISFENSRGVYYEYRLLQEPEKWTRTYNQSVTFYGLAPGSYTFEIKAFNYKGIESNNIISFSFNIKPHFWQTTLFKILAFTLLIGLLVWIIMIRERMIKKEQQKKAAYDYKISEIELEAIKAQINPHFIYNCLNSIQNSILKNNTEESHKQLSLFSKLIRTTLDLSKLNFITLASEMAYLDMYLQLEKMRFRDKLQFTIKAAENIPVHEIEIPVMLLQPFVENAVKHGLKMNESSTSEVRVAFTLNSGILVCSIEDSGAGIKAEKDTENEAGAHKPLGMLISSGRADTYNKLFHSNIHIRFIDKKEIGPAKTGTIVLIQIPLK
jgi:ligand-binding sensor domain-containing protein